jgi:hypothetical protein
LKKENKKIFEWYNYMDQQQENKYGSRRWLIKMDIQTPLVPTRMDRRTPFSRK